MKKSQIIGGLIVAVCIPLFILPARISEGQMNDPVNLIGSEIVIFLMSFTCWACVIYIQRQPMHIIWRLVLSLICCCVLSNVFYFMFNPIFKDFPFRTTESQLVIKILMLSSRGVLLSVIIIPSAYFILRDYEAKSAKRKNEILALEKAKIQNLLLEQAVSERTRALQQALESLEHSQQELERQLYVQSRLVASITHDIRGPFGFLLLVSEKIAQLAASQQYEMIPEYSKALHSAHENMFNLIKDLLEFAKLPMYKSISISETVNLAELVEQKASLFSGVIEASSNKLLLDMDSSIHVKSNFMLLSIVLHNILDNANKHTADGEIVVCVRKVNETNRLTVLNPSASIPKQIIEWVNSDQSHLDPRTFINSNDPIGIGLVLVKEISFMLDIELLIEDSATETAFHLIFNDIDSVV